MYSSWKIHRMYQADNANKKMPLTGEVMCRRNSTHTDDREDDKHYKIFLPRSVICLNPTHSFVVSYLDPSFHCQLQSVCTFFFLCRFLPPSPSLVPITHSSPTQERPRRIPPPPFLVQTSRGPFLYLLSQESRPVTVLEIDNWWSPCRFLPDFDLHRFVSVLPLQLRITALHSHPDWNRTRRSRFISFQLITVISFYPVVPSHPQTT